ncbi:MAG: hypothetical protein QXK88_05490 [Desulfurococcaceae archaeon]
MVNKLPQAWKIAALLNRGYNLAEVCKFLGMRSASKLSSTISRLIRTGVMSKHVVVPLEALKHPVSIAILEKYQKTNKPCFKRAPRTILQYYAFSGGSTEIYYLLENCALVEDLFDPAVCRLEICEQVVNTLTPLENPDEAKLRLVPIGNLLKHCAGTLDDLDQDLLLDVFRLFNPPIERVKNNKSLILLLEQRLGTKGARYHYYKHIKKCVVQHYALRGMGDFILLLVYSASAKELEDLLNTLVENELVNGVWQVTCLTNEPIIALIHSWGQVEKFVDPDYVHEYIKNTNYTVYPVIGVSHGFATSSARS